jgi:hypothetical protein
MVECGAIVSMQEWAASDESERIGARASLNEPVLLA